LARECDLLKFRVQKKLGGVCENELGQFVVDNELSYQSVSEKEFARVSSALRSLYVGSGMLRGNAQSMANFLKHDGFYKVEWSKVLNLVKHRKVLLHRGAAFVPSTHMLEMVLADYRFHLAEQLNRTFQAFPKISQDERVLIMVDSLRKQAITSQATYTTSGHLHKIDMNQIDALSQQSFPLCMRHLHQRLRSHHHLKHWGRMQYGLFLKAIGVTLEDAILFWRNEFCRHANIDLKKFNQEYLYNIRHNYGLEGKRTNYSPYGCYKIITKMAPAADQHHGCPFRHFDAKALSRELRANGVSNMLDIQEIIGLAKDSHYQLACKKYFLLKHASQAPDSKSITIRHPNEYFDLSRKLLDSTLSSSSSSSSLSYATITKQLSATVYINGTFSGHRFFPMSDSSTSNIHNFFLFRYQTTTANSSTIVQFFEGQTSEIRIWNKTLSQNQIQHNMGIQLNPTGKPGLVAYWPANDCEGTLIKDVVPPNAFDASIITANWDNSTYPPIEVPCPFNCTGNAVACNDGTCVCRQGYYGDYCQHGFCNPECTSGHGTCQVPNEGKSPYCVCFTPWFGASCDDIEVSPSSSSNIIIANNTSCGLFRVLEGASVTITGFIYVNDSAFIFGTVLFRLPSGGVPSDAQIIYSDQNDYDWPEKYTETLAKHTQDSTNPTLGMLIRGTLSVSVSGQLLANSMSQYTSLPSSSFPPLASHGGLAFNKYCSPTPGPQNNCTNPTYGNYEQPTHFGQAAIPPMNTNPCGSVCFGGGSLAFIASAVQLFGTISANGIGFASGGSIWIDIVREEYVGGEGMIVGDGAVTANGGDSLSGGGRIALTNFSYFSSNITLEAYGHGGGAPGTIFMLSVFLNTTIPIESTYLIIDNGPVGMNFVNETLFQTLIPGGIHYQDLLLLELRNAKLALSPSATLGVDKCVIGNAAYIDQYSQNRISCAEILYPNDPFTTPISTTTPTSQPTTKPPPHDSSPRSMDVATIISIVIASLLGLIIIVAGVAWLIWWWRKKHSRRGYKLVHVVTPSSLEYVTISSDRVIARATSSRRREANAGSIDDAVTSAMTGYELDFRDVQVIHPPIAKGGYGVVNRAIYKGTIVAVKTLFEHLGELPLDEFVREIQNLGRLHHPNIVMLMGACKDPLCIITEFVERGSLFDVIRKHPEDLTPKRIIQIVTGAVRGLAYLHGQNPPILHRDLKSANILITRNYEAKIADFGLSRSLSTNPSVTSQSMTKKVGTTRWNAPEVLNSLNYSEKADCYSFGMVLYEIFEKKLPFHEEMWDSKVEEHIIAGFRPEIPESCPQIFANIIKACWASNPEDRPTFTQILLTITDPHDKKAANTSNVASTSSSSPDTPFSVTFSNPFSHQAPTTKLPKTPRQSERGRSKRSGGLRISIVDQDHDIDSDTQHLLSRSIE